MFKSTRYRIALCNLLIPGIAAAQSPAGAMLPERSVVQVHTIGERTEDALDRVDAIAFDSRGRLYVLYEKERQVELRDSVGRRIRRVAQAGGGPGELQTPWRIRVHRDTIAVNDEVAGRHRFVADGAWIDTDRDADGRIERFGLRGGGTLTFVDPLPMQRLPHDGLSSASPYLRHLIVTEKNGRTDTLRSWRTDHSVGVSEFRRHLSSTGFGQEAAWGLLGDSVIIIADGYTGDVLWWRVSSAGLTVVRQDSMRQRSPPVTKEDISAAERRIARSSFMMTLNDAEPTRYEASQAPRLLSPPSRHSVATQVIVSSNGDVWISAARIENTIRTRKTDFTSKVVVRANDWTVFPAMGAPFRVTLPDDRALLGVHGTTLYVTEVGDPFVIHLLKVR